MTTLFTDLTYEDSSAILKDLERQAIPFELRNDGATIMVPKVTLKNSANIELFGGVVQSATADAVVDCLIDGTIPKDIANELCIISLVWIDPRCAKDPNLDKKDMYRTNHEATKLAIRRALRHEPSIEELIANRSTIRHDMDDWS